MISVDAFALVEINELCFVGAARFEEVEEEGLLSFFGINDSDSGVDLLAKAFDGIDLAVIADRALNVVVVGRVEIFLDHIGCEDDLADARSTNLAVRGFRQIKGEVSRLLLAVAHYKGVKKRFL